MNIALILSGGTGSRMGTEIPKQYMEAGGRLVISYCLETLVEHTSIDAVQIVAHESWRDIICESVPQESVEVFRRKLRGFSAPGENRQLSIWNGLVDIRTYAGTDDLVLIHDAARPMLSDSQTGQVLRAAEGHDGVMPALPMKDTVYASQDGCRIHSLLDRERIFAGQAPEVFRLGSYYEANLMLMPERILGIKGSAEPAVMAQLDIVMIPGDEGNFKITTMQDMERFREKKNEGIRIT